ncbi:MAG: hypothetical protein GEV10_03050 [Streptosporangiales bacterium]|nr:hypothetical protein [Streptosporangiales bacterium]
MTTPPPQDPSGGYGAPQPANESSKTLGIIGVVCAVICWPAGLIIAIIGLNKVKQTGESDSLFKAALIVSIIVGVLGIIGSIANFSMAAGMS